MKYITIQRLRLENFKAHSFLELDFAGQSQTIYGDNATGKSTVYDALTWLLFGKDSRGNSDKNIEIKPLDTEGNVKDHQAVTSVTAVLQVTEDGGGGEITLRKQCREAWVARRGSSALVYDGNTFDYFVDEVPCKKNEYDRRIRELVSEDVFRLLTSTRYFPSDLDWRKRREILHELSGIGGWNDASIMATDERFRPLLDALNGLSTDDFRKKTEARRRALTGNRDEIPARINELEKTAADLACIDFDGAERALASVNEQQEQLQRELALLRNNQAVTEKEQQIQAVTLRRRELEAENRSFRRQQELSQPDLRSLEANVNRIGQLKARAKERIRYDEETILKHEELIENERQNWIEVNNQAFSGGLCPSCGQALPVDKLAEQKERFETNKQRRLSSIQQIAGRYAEAKEKACKDLEEDNATLAEIRADEIKAKQTLEAARQQGVRVSDLDGYAGNLAVIDEELRGLEQALTALLNDEREQEQALKQKLADLAKEKTRLSGEVGKKMILEYSQKRIETLRDDAAASAKELEGVEQLLWLLEEFVRYKTGFVEDSVNGRFRLARFRLFREQANGGLEERCDVTYDGVPYISLNSGMQTNVGIDVIRVLSEHYGCRVPLFIDNAEGVTKLEPIDTQVIRLVVSEQDKTLRMEESAS